ncbi:hypothetical protein AB1Y20_015165 [Prymnesium parvum]|uniref:Uncharacterized protein n=1 Tax=Prymnesium parvum TaxID=97485 RepID=A0AB34JVZ1_PRYPA
MRVPFSSMTLPILPREFDVIASTVENLHNSRIRDLTQTLPEMQKEWRRAKDEFSERKQRLIDKETKKRMLEEVWQDRGEMTEQEEKEVEREMKLKKQAVSRTKKANQKRREQLRVQAQTIERGISEMKEKEETLRSLLQHTEQAILEENVRKARAAEQAAAVAQMRADVDGMAEQIRHEEEESEKLRQKLRDVQSEALKTKQEMQGVVEQCSTLEQQLDHASRNAQALEMKQGERAAWYEQMSSIMCSLAGVKNVTAVDDHVQYELPSGHTLTVYFAPTGEIAEASLSPDDGYDISDLQAYAIRTNSLHFLLRETQHRLSHLTAPRQPRLKATHTAPAHERSVVPFSSREQTSSGVHDTVTLGTAMPAQAVRVLTPPMVAQNLHTETHSGMLFENLEKRMSFPSPAPPGGSADPKFHVGTPVGPQRSLRSTNTPRSGRRQEAAEPEPTAAADSCVPTPSPKPRRQSLVPSVADTEPRSEYGCVDSTFPRKGNNVAAAATRAKGTAAMAAAEQMKRVTSCLGDAQVVAVDDRRRSRKSFARSVSHPRSPCSRAARAGIEMDAKELISSSRKSNRSQFTAIDRYGEKKAILSADGSFMTPDGRVLGYFEPDGSVGGPELQYLGRVSMPCDQGSDGFVTDDLEPERILAVVDYGRATIKTPQGSTIAELRKSGQVVSHLGASCGTLEGFDFHAMQAAAAYLIFLDPAFVKDE